MGGGNANVHRQGHGDADADRWAVDGGDHRLSALVDAQRQQAPAIGAEAAFPVRAGVRIKGVASGGEIGPGAEAAAGAGDDDGPHPVVCVGGVEGVDHFRLHFLGEGVELLRTIERQGEDAILQVGQNGVVWHGVGLLWSEGAILHHLELYHQGAQRVPP